ncbi:MAG: selenocysteine-specific translation elongation factor [Planctomycetota bacterium]|nr:selenocysteine-specific translation elongation factor [Planctomycetota bacterium]MDA1248305.1 selenocysteine-specific translation elongation factor [Planctomycetota bacterium]
MTAETQTTTKSVLIGTAGHIDHGKTRLVGKLTGVNTDRLPEEKARGISIDLGFAHISDGDLRIGVIDVPGHERFVRNMVAGATGINVAVLVVAADDGVMPQTREHLEIMDLLGIPTGLIALTKIDIVDEDLVELAKLDIEESVAGTFLEGAPVIPVSSETGEGIDELRQAILDTCREIELPESLPLFRLAIDRVFSITGHGTVVTGSVLSGDVQVGATLDLWPEGRQVRVRSVERHGEQTEEAGSRQRTAINLAGVKHEEVSRGCELATAGYLQTTRRLLVDLRVLSSSPMPLKDRVEVNLHIGTREVETRVILKGRRLEPGERGYAELRLAEPIVAAFGQRFILRRVSPAVTIGGGRILDPAIPDLLRIRNIEELAENLDSDSGAERLSVYLGQRDSIRAGDLTIASAVGLMPDELETQLNELREAGSIVTLGERDRTFEIHASRLDALSRSILRTIREEVIRHQPRRSLPKPTLLTACREITTQHILEAVIAWLLKKKELVKIGENLGPADLQVKLTKAQSKNRQAMLDQITSGSLTPPLAKELAESIDQKPAEANQLLNLTEEDGLIVKVADGLFFTPEALDLARVKCKETLAEIEEATMAQLRDGWGVTRKYSVPLCEYFDSIGVTVRRDNIRIAGEKIDTPIGAMAERS